LKENILFENINKVKTNTLITLTKKSMTKAEDSNNYYIFCNKCNTILGFELKHIANEKDENENDNKDSNEYNCYFLKKNIKERKNKNININLISFKENLLNSIKEELNQIFNEIKNINIKINLTPLTKQNFEDFSQFYKKNQFDFTFVIHKMEGRIFLLGNNGYFNAVENCLIKKQNSNLFFVLLSNEVDDNENKKIIEELIYKGGEERLEKYYKNDRIIFIDNYEIKQDINKKKEWFIDKIKDIYGNENNNNINKYYIQSERNAYVVDKRKIDNMIEYLNNQDKKGHSGCFS
jgi:hypothetical protein